MLTAVQEHAHPTAMVEERATPRLEFVLARADLLALRARPRSTTTSPVRETAAAARDRAMARQGRAHVTAVGLEVGFFLPWFCR